MKLFTLLSLASLALASAAFTGCAADTTDAAANGADDVEPGVSQDDLTSRSAKFVGTYSWRATDSGDFVDFQQLTLKADGTYTAHVDSGLVNPAVRCIAFPCTLPESGTWNVLKSGSQLKLKVDPTGPKPSRSYTASIVDLSRTLTLTRYSHTTTLFTPAPPPAAACVTSGCSGQVCADHSVITTCDWRPEYACYHSATCERQADGACGWTSTPALTSCIANATP